MSEQLTGRDSWLWDIDPSRCMEELTPEVLKELGQMQHDIVERILPHWQAVTGNDDWSVLACELEMASLDFIRALAAALKKGE